MLQGPHKVEGGAACESKSAGEAATAAATGGELLGLGGTLAEGVWCQWDEQLAPHRSGEDEGAEQVLGDRLGVAKWAGTNQKAMQRVVCI